MNKENRDMDTSGPSLNSNSNLITSQRRWQLENNIVETADSIYKYDIEEQQMIRGVKPWEKDPHYFKVNFLLGL